MATYSTMLGMSKSINKYNYPFNVLTLLAGQQERHLACKTFDVGLLVVMI